MAGMTKNILVSLFLLVALDQGMSAAAAESSYTHVCKDHDGPVDTCTIDTVPAGSGEHKCCPSISYSFNYNPSPGKSVYTCCHESTADFQTGYCNDETARHYCKHTLKYCCNGKCAASGKCSAGAGLPNIGGKGNNALLLSMIGIATIVIFISMAIAPIPLMNFKAE